jgi:hypothetical protein
VTVLGAVTVPSGVFTPDQSLLSRTPRADLRLQRGAASQTLDLGDRVCVTGQLSALPHSCWALAKAVTQVSPVIPVA